MIEEYAVWIISQYGISQRGLEIGTMDLMIVRAKPLEIVSSVCPGF